MNMEILIFIAVIIVLIVVHEFGHFVAAKLSGMRVDEFGLGYPPRAMTFAKVGGTSYTLNWLPFGGFVKIFGEDGEGGDPRAFSKRPRVLQALVLIAGIAMNLLFAYVLITGALIVGTPRALSDTEIATSHTDQFSKARDSELMVASVIPGSPAALAGLLPGDSIVSAKDRLGAFAPIGEETYLGNQLPPDPKNFSAFVAHSGKNAITLVIKRNGEEQTITTTPAEGVVESDPTRYALGVALATVGVVPLPFGAAIVEGASLTWGAIELTAVGLSNFFYGIFTFSADLSQVSGPIGIAGAVGTASMQGLGYLFSIMAIISINLALINLIPVPALDGGRLLFVIVESIIRRPIKASVANAINSIGFILLVLLMVVVTAHDIFKIVG
jgi:regulator of sigma E protease